MFIVDQWSMTTLDMGSLGNYNLDSKEREKTKKTWFLLVIVMITVHRHRQRLQPGEKGQHLVH